MQNFSYYNNKLLKLDIVNRIFFQQLYKFLLINFIN